MDKIPLIESQQRIAAKVAAIAYLVPLVFYASAHFGLRSGLYDPADMVGTIQRVEAAESLLRWSVAFELVYCIGGIVLLSALYIVLVPVNRHMALLGALLWFAYVVTAILMALNILWVIRLVGDSGYVEPFGSEPVAGLVGLTWSATGDQFRVGMALWGISSAVFGSLWLKSRYIPTALALYGIASSAWCAFCFFAVIIHPGFSAVVNPWWFDTPMGLFYIALSLLLLIKGLRMPIHPPEAALDSPASA